MPVIGREGVNALLIRPHASDIAIGFDRVSAWSFPALQRFAAWVENSRGGPHHDGHTRPPALCSEETALSDHMPQTPTITLYTSAICPYCTSAKNFLKSKGLDWTEIRIDTDPAERERMMARAKRTSVPQIFVGDVHVGGFDDMMALHRAGKFEPLLSGDGA